MSVVASAPAATSTVVRLEDVGRSFGPTRALDGVTLDLRGGEVLAVAGANGAGKSTLNRILAGALAPDTGRILVDGEPLRLADPQDAVAAGIRTVHQHAGEWTVPGLTVAENLLLEEIATGRGVAFSPRRSREDARRIAAGLRFEFTDAQLAADVATLGVSDRQLIALARALATSPRVLILDEPTSALSTVEAERLFDVVRGLRDDGVAIVYVSHRLGELEALADRVAVLRDGRLRRVFERPFAMRDVVAEVLGEIVDEIEHAERQGGRVRVLLEDVQVLPDGPPVDVGFAAGEVTGLTGLIGAGKTELAEVLFGVRRARSGRVLLDGAPFAPGSPGAAIGTGVFMVPEDRAAQALVAGWSVRANSSLPFLARLTSLGLVRKRAEADRARRIIDMLGVVCAGPEAPIGSLSGGNQQKVVIGRWLAEDARVLIFDEPFRGVDIGARRDIAHRLRSLSDDRGRDRHLLRPGRDPGGGRPRAGDGRRRDGGGRAPQRGRSHRDRARDDEGPDVIGEQVATTTAPAARRGAGTVQRGVVRFGLLGLFALVTVYFAVTEPAFRTSDNILSVIQSVSVVGLLALAVTVSMAVGGFDLSVGANAGMVVMVSALGLVVWEWPTSLVIVAALATGAAIGLVNAGLIVGLRIPDLLATLGVLFAIQGLQLLPSEGQSVSTGMVIDDVEQTGRFTDAFLWIGREDVLGVPVPVIILFVAGALMWVFMERTRWGRMLYAIGGNEEAARLAGVRVRRWRTIAYLVSGLLSALGGIILAARIGQGDVGAGNSFLLDAVAATLIGFAVLAVNRPNVLGTVVGALFLGIVLNGLTIKNLPYYTQDFVKGLILMVALFLSFGLLRRT